MKKDALGERMKGYEKVSRLHLMRRNPVVIRIDGKAFHTFTKGMKKPFDNILMESMDMATKFLCENIQGCKMGYTQSDEISLLLVDYDKIDTSAWFDNNIQKIASVSASMATLAFNKAFSELAGEYIYRLENYNTREDEIILYKEYGVESFVNEEGEVSIPEKYEKLLEVYKKRLMTALFDSRVFSLPKEEVVNYFIWRQQDAIRNSIQSVGQANFSHKELNGKSTNTVKEMLKEKSLELDWDALDTKYKNGRCLVKVEYELKDRDVKRTKWVVDTEIPVFKKDRYYIRQHI